MKNLFLNAALLGAVVIGTAGFSACATTKSAEAKEA